MRLLVVDDDPMMARAVSQAAVALGHEAVAVASAQEARRVLAQSCFDALLTDETLGGGESGTSLLAWACDHHPELARALMSGQSAGPLNDGPDASLHFLPKPFSLTQLEITLERLEVRSRRSEG